MTMVSTHGPAQIRVDQIDEKLWEGGSLAEDPFIMYTRG